MPQLRQCGFPAGMRPWWILKETDLHRDELDFLRDNNHRIEFITRKKSDLATAFQEAAKVAVRVTLTFAFVVFAFTVRFWWIAILFGLAAFLIIYVWGDSVSVLFRSAAAGKWFHTNEGRRSFLYWVFWPFWICTLCILAALAGSLLGNYLWLTGFEKYYQLEQLRTYTEIDPKYVSGKQLMDAGLVEFSNYVGIDRMHGGCFHNGGKNYCVSPIVHGGKILSGIQDAPQVGSYDLFAVGIDCCNCPNNDFKCGAWDDPLAQGGLRSMDFRSRPFFRLAVDDFSAAFRKTVAHPIFFEWVADANYSWRAPWYWAFHLIVIAVCWPVPITFIIALLLGHLLRVLVDENLASPLEMPGPPMGYEKAWERALPEMREHWLEEQRQLLGTPGLPRWYTSMASSAVSGPPIGSAGHFQRAPGSPAMQGAA